MPKARSDLRELAAYIATDSPRSSRRFLEAAQAAFERLARAPEIGARCEFANPVYADLRMWPVRGFENDIVVYRPITDGVEVVRVLHGTRDLRAVFES